MQCANSCSRPQSRQSPRHRRAAWWCKVRHTGSNTHKHFLTVKRLSLWSQVSWRINQVISVREEVNPAQSHSFHQLRTKKLSTPGARDQRDQRGGLVSVPDCDVVFHAKATPISRRSSIALWIFCVSWDGRDDMILFKKRQKTRNSRWSCGHVHPCSRLRFSKQTAESNKNPQPRSSAPSTIEHRVDAVVAVQKLWRDLTVTEIAKTMNLQECLAR